MLQYWSIWFCALSLRWLPLRAGYAIATVVADIVFLVWRQGRANILDNMSHVLGDNATPRQVREMAKRSLRNYAKYTVDYLRLSFTKVDEITRQVTCTHWPKFESLADRGRGMLIVGMHMGNWDLGPAMLCQRDYDVSVVVESFKYSRMNDFVQGIRTKCGMNAIPLERATRGILNALKKKHFLGILIDRPTQERGVQVRFFDAPTYVPAGAATLALRTGAPVVTFAVVRTRDNKFLTLYDDNIAIEPSGDFEKDVQYLTQKIIDSLEKMIRNYPDQWYMFRPMWSAQTQSHAATRI